MCGIAGIYSKSGAAVAADAVAPMVSGLAHRGPDGQGIETLGRVALGHTRLAVIDLSEAGRQPMRTASGRVWVTVNGEIYNYRALRAELESSGCELRSQTDSEVIPWLLETGGVEALSRLDGMFAFALWDAVEQRLVLGRDRTGQKPLFVYEDDAQLAFASELGALLQLPGIDDALAVEDVLAEYLTYGYAPTPKTFYRNIRKLAPGSWLVADADGVRERAWWEWPVRSSEASEQKAAEEVRGLLTSAVSKRLMSDVPLGAFLSGGIDSTLVVALMAQLGDRPRTFSIGFDGDAAYDETEFARMAARHFDTDHTEFRVDAAQLQDLDGLVESYGEPFGDSSALPTRIVSRLAREHVTVVLTGDGGDELFAGYDRFAAALMRDAVPDGVGRVLELLGKPLPSGRSAKGLLARGKRFLDAAGQDVHEAYRQWVSLFSVPEVDALTEVGAGARAVQHYQRVFDSVASAGGQRDLLNELLVANARNYLLDDLNVKVDRATMATGLEARAPFLDTALIEYAFSLPGDLKMRGRRGKWILKQAFADQIPAEIRGRKKMGFGIPLAAWFRGPLRSLAEEHLRPANARIYQWLNPEPVGALLDAHLQGRADCGQRLWLLLTLERWLQKT